MVRNNIRLQYSAPVTPTFFLYCSPLWYWGTRLTTGHLFRLYHSSMKDPLFYIRLFGHVLAKVVGITLLTTFFSSVSSHLPWKNDICRCNRIIGSS